MRRPPVKQSNWLRPRRLLHAVACGLAILAPLLTTTLLVHLVHGSTLRDFTPPSHTNDETAYWHQTASFASHGFDIGLYATDEEQAPLRFSRFGAYGPAFPILYGSIARFTGGWRWHSAPFIHLLLISLGVATLLLLARPTTSRVFLIAAFLATFWPMAFLIQTNMQEGLHYAIGLVAVGLFSRLAQLRATASLRFTTFSYLFILGAGMVRITWLVLLIPFVLCRLRRLSLRAVAFASAGALGAGTLAALLSSALSSQHSLIAMTLTKFYGAGIKGTGEILWARFLVNISNFFQFEGQQPLAVLQRHQYMLLLVGLAVAELINRRDRQLHKVVFHCLNLLVILVLTLFAYWVMGFGDYRLLSVHLLVCAMYLGVSTGRASSIIVGLLLTSNIFIGPMFVTTYRQAWAYVYSGSLRAKILDFQRDIAGHVAHESDVDFWCNTVSLWYEPSVGYPAELAGIAPGIGINVRFDLEDPSLPPSRYLLMSYDRFQPASVRVGLRHLATVTTGGHALLLVENPQVACGRQASGSEAVNPDASGSPVEEFCDAGAPDSAVPGSVHDRHSLASSCFALRNAGQTRDGAYAITVGASELTVCCDMTTDGGGWTLLFDQDVAKGYEPISSWVSGVNTDDPASGHYSILNHTAHFGGASPGFEFYIDWPNEGNSFVRWEQSENPLLGRGTVAGIVESPANQVGCSSFAGLQPGISTALHGSTGGCEWWAIGTSAPYSGGLIPAYERSDAGPLLATRTRLWVRATQETEP